MQQILEKLITWIMHHPTDRAGRCFFYSWAAVLLIVGGFLWGLIFNWGNEPFVLHDWVEITAPRLAFLKDSVDQGVLPLHISDPSALGGVTDRFMSTPDVLLSPQILLLKWMSIGRFTLVNIWLLYASGFAGLVWLCNRQKISMAGMTVLFFVLNFNGGILAHLAVGHYTWSAYLLLPWLLGLILELFSKPVGWGWVLRFGIVMLVILLQGGYHLFVYTLIALVMVAILGRRYFWRSIQAIIASILLGALRLLPLFIDVAGFKDKTTYYGGYANLTTVWDSLIQPVLPFENSTSLGLTEPITSWELNTYIGLAAALFLLFFGIILAIKNRRSESNITLLLFPIVGLITLSLDRVFRYVRLILPLPIFTGERVAARFFSLALALLVVLAVIEFQRWLDAQKPNPAYFLIGISLMIIFVHDLWQNLLSWTLPATIDRAPTTSPYGFNPAAWTVANHSDGLYFTLLWIGIAVSLMSFAILLTLSLRGKRIRALA